MLHAVVWCRITIVVALLGLSAPATGSAAEPAPSAGVERPLRLPPGPGNPRNSEGAFITLKDGRVMFIYTHFDGKGSGSDFDHSHLTARFSSDGGKSWTKTDTLVLENEAKTNTMSVSLLRLQNGDIALFYCRKNSLTDCIPYVRISRDEAKTWSEPQPCITDIPGYYVLNNDRVVQLKSGRLVAPVAEHGTTAKGGFDGHGIVMCYLSDDNGKTWRRNQTKFDGKTATGRTVLQEPGVVELKDGSLLMFIRTNGGSQFLSHSKDGGETWSAIAPSKILSPVSPASIKRIPKTGDLLLVWNNHENIDAARRGKRTPLSVAISSDEGQTWTHVKNLEDDVHGWYCYTAIEFVGDHVLLGHCAGDRRTNGLATTQITRFSLDWLYGK